MRPTLFLICLFLFSCGAPKNETQIALSDADSMVINFNYPGTDSIQRTVSTTEGHAIDDLTGFLSGQKKTPSKCSLDGDLQFYQKGTLIGTIVFSYATDSCKQFVIVEQDGTFHSLSMSNKAKDLLSSLQQGRS